MIVNPHPSPCNTFAWFNELRILASACLIVLSCAPPCLAQTRQTISQQVEQCVLNNDLPQLKHLMASPPTDVQQRLELVTSIARFYLVGKSDFDARFKELQATFDRCNTFAISHRQVAQLQLADAYVQSLLFTVLPGRDRADLFLALGLTSPRINAESTMIVNEALRALQDAQSNWRELDSTLPQEEDFTREWVYPGTWNKLFLLGDRNLPYLKAWTCFYKSMLDSPNRKTDWLNDASSNIEQAWEHRSSLDQTTIAMMCFLKGCIQLELANDDAALQAVNQASSLTIPPTTDLVIHLLQARVLHALLKDDEAQKILAAAGSIPLLDQEPIYGVLLADVQASTRVSAATWRKNRLAVLLNAHCFEPYEQLLTGDGAAPWHSSLETFIFDRFASIGNSESNPADEPPFMQLSRAYALRQHHQADDPDNHASLQTARDMLSRLVERKDVSPFIKAQSLYNLAAVETLLGLDAQAITHFTQTMALPHGGYLGPEAARLAATLAERHYLARTASQENDKDAAIQYDRVLQAIFSRYPDSDLTSDLACNHASVLYDLGEYDKAQAACLRVPMEDPRYPEALFLRVQAIAAAQQHAAPDQAQKWTPTLREAVQTAVTRIEAALNHEKLNPDRNNKLRSMQARARLVWAQHLIDQTEADPQAIPLLAAVDSSYADLPDIRRQAVLLHIRAAEVFKQFSDARQWASRLIRESPDDAGSVILSLLRSMRNQTDPAKLNAVPAEAQTITESSAQIADLLQQWMRQHPPADELAQSMNRAMAYSWLAAGRYEQARQLYQLLAEQQANDIEIVHGLAECDYQVALSKDDDPSLLARASDLFSRIITACDQQKRGHDWYYYQAWARICSAMDRTTPAPNVRIYLGLRRLMQTDPDAAKSPFAQTYNDLIRKHTVN